MVNTVLPFAPIYPLCIFRSDVELAIDGATWILISYTLIGLIKPDTNWVHLPRTQSSRIVGAAEAGRVNPTNPEHGSREPAHMCSSVSGKE